MLIIIIISSHSPMVYQINKKKHFKIYLFINDIYLNIYIKHKKLKVKYENFCEYAM